MQQTARKANTKFWGIGQSFATLTFRFDMTYARLGAKIVRWHGTNKKHLAGWQTTQRVRKTRRLHHSKSIYPFFSRSHCVDAIQQGVCLYHVTRILQKAHTGQ